MRDIKRYIEGCNLSQRIKNRIEISVGKLIANEVLEKSWIYLIVDFITKLLLVVKKDMILVVCDKLSKIAYFIATIEEISAEGLVGLFRNHMWKLYGLPESVISDKRL